MTYAVHRTYYVLRPFAQQRLLHNLHYLMFNKVLLDYRTKMYTNRYNYKIRIQGLRYFSMANTIFEIVRLITNKFSVVRLNLFVSPSSVQSGTVLQFYCYYYCFFTSLCGKIYICRDIRNTDARLSRELRGALQIKNITPEMEAALIPGIDISSSRTQRSEFTEAGDKSQSRLIFCTHPPRASNSPRSMQISMCFTWPEHTVFGAIPRMAIKSCGGTNAPRGNSIRAHAGINGRLFVC